MQSMEGKVCIITGASSGIGHVTCRALLKAGASVLGVDLAEASSSLASFPRFRFHQCDLTDSSAPANIVAACCDAFSGRIDALYNIAGIMDSFGSVDTLTDQEWDRVIAVNLSAPVKLMRAVVPVMQRQRCGSIVNVASKAATSGAVAGVAYTSSKHGLLGATKNVAWRYKDYKIRCNAICPGAVETNIMTSVGGLNLDLEAYSVSEIVIKCHKETDHIKTKRIASLLLFLGSDASEGVSGSVIAIDSAWSVI